MEAKIDHSLHDALGVQNVESQNWLHGTNLGLNAHFDRSMSLKLASTIQCLVESPHAEFLFVSISDYRCFIPWKCSQNNQECYFVLYLVMVSVGKNCSSLLSRLRRVSVKRPAKASVSRKLRAL